MNDTPAFILDANCCNARQLSAELNKLEALRERGVVTLVYAKSSHDEARFGDARRAEKTDQFSWIEINRYGHNPEVAALIESILFPDGARDDNERADVRAVYIAERLRWPLITQDGASKTQPRGILGNAKRLYAELGIEVLRPNEALERAVNATRPA